MSVKVFSNNLRFQVVLCVLAVANAVNVVTGDSEIRFPGLDVSITEGIFNLGLPVAMLFLWTRFGHLFNSLIQNRVVLWKLLDALKDPKHSDVLTLRSLLHDHALLDAYFLHFHPRLHMLWAPGRWASATILGSYAGVFGAIHTAILGTAYLGGRSAVAGNVHPLLVVGHVLFVLFLLLFLAFTHYHFLVVGRNPNWLHYVVAVTWLTFLWTFLAIV